VGERTDAELVLPVEFLNHALQTRLKLRHFDLSPRAGAAAAGLRHAHQVLAVLDAPSDIGATLREPRAHAGRVAGPLGVLGVPPHDRNTILDGEKVHAHDLARRGL